MVSVTLFMFASIKDILSPGVPEVVVRLERTEWSSCEELKKYLLDLMIDQFRRRHRPDDQLLELPSERTIWLSINDSYVHTDVPLVLAEGDRLGLIPPIVGG